VLEFDGEQPRPVGLPVHAIRRRVPMVEIPNQTDGLGLRRIADKIHGAQRFVRTVHIPVHIEITPRLVNSKGS
jgi:hypothetical protein